jgi:uncharacterized protein (TIGR02266 family)
MSSETIEARQNRQTPEQVISALAHHRKEMEARRGSIDERRRALDDEERRVEEAAAEIEERIRLLAEEEMKLQQQKKEIREQAGKIGAWRKSIQDRRREIAAELGNVQAEVQAIEARKALAERQQARREAQKRAIVTCAAQGKGWHTQERRSSPRVAVEVDVSLHTRHNFYAGLTRDLSEGGLFIATIENIPVGTLLDLRVTVPDHGTIRAKGEVRWVREYNDFNQDFDPGVGVQFVDLRETDRQTIEHFIRRREPLFYDNYS